ncbi:unnamed protein product [Soboliphyme baturini]|uniref:DUF4201 domain-containing protein n=1 Tax=Soboliphyme baturini TaxID=241478 RepID=A0A183ILZ2_9BILA|nr:unnamed protein product [Soboliphyme baturini]
MTCNRCEAKESSISALEARLSDREKQLSDLFDKYKKEKFQFKAKLLQLSRQLSAKQEDGESFDKFIENFQDDETLLLRYRSEIENLNAALVRKNTEINDHKIRIRDLEKKLREAAVNDHRHHAFSRESALKRDKDVLALFEAELQNFYSQIELKDKHILQLSQELEEKSEQVQSLVEACQEKDEVILAKTRANQVRICFCLRCEMFLLSFVLLFLGYVYHIFLHITVVCRFPSATSFKVLISARSQISGDHVVHHVHRHFSCLTGHK